MASLFSGAWYSQIFHSGGVFCLAPFFFFRLFFMLHGCYSKSAPIQAHSYSKFYISLVPSKQGNSGGEALYLTLMQMVQMLYKQITTILTRKLELTFCVYTLAHWLATCSHNGTNDSLIMVSRTLSLPYAPTSVGRVWLLRAERHHCTQNGRARLEWTCYSVHVWSCLGPHSRLHSNHHVWV